MKNDGLAGRLDGHQAGKWIVQGADDVLPRMLVSLADIDQEGAPVEQAASTPDIDRG